MKSRVNLLETTTNRRIIMTLLKILSSLLFFASISIGTANASCGYKSDGKYHCGTNCGYKSDGKYHCE